MRACLGGLSSVDQRQGAARDERRVPRVEGLGAPESVRGIGPASRPLVGFCQAKLSAVEIRIEAERLFQRFDRVRRPAGTLLSSREQQRAFLISGLVVDDVPEEREGLFVRAGLRVEAAEHQVDVDVEEPLGPGLLESDDGALGIVRRVVARLERLSLVRQGGVDRTEDLVGLLIIRILFEGGLRGFERLFRAVVAGVETGELSPKLRGCRSQRDGLFVGGDCLVQLAFAFEVPAQNEVYAGSSVVEPVRVASGAAGVAGRAGDCPARAGTADPIANSRTRIAGRISLIIMDPA